MKRVLENVERLNLDAKLLLKSKRYPSSRFFMILAKEEIGKFFLLADKWAAQQDISPGEYKEIFRSGGAHARKLAASGRVFLKTEAWQNMGDFFAEHDQEAKERSLYVDYQESAGFGYWVNPSKDLDNEEFAKAVMGKDFGEIRKFADNIEELDLGYQTDRISSVVISLRNFIREQGKVLPGKEPPNQPVIVAPARQPPTIEVEDELTLDYLVKKYEECDHMLNRQEIEDLAPEPPSELPSLSWPVPSLDELQEAIEKIPSQNGKKAIVLYNLGLLRTNLFVKLHGKTMDLRRLKSYDSAASLMNEYATKFAIPFNSKESQIGKALRLAKNVRPGPFGPRENYVSCGEQDTTAGSRRPSRSVQTSLGRPTWTSITHSRCFRTIHSQARTSPESMSLQKMSLTGSY